MTSGPLCWSPDWVELFLADWLPRKGVLDAVQRGALPEVLRRWIRFALDRRGVEPEWIAPVVAAVDAHLPVFAEAFDDSTAWGPAKQIAAELAARGVDLSDRDAVDGAVRALNAERLARYVSGEHSSGG
ncbi:RecX family transcriptional regulator [Micromonospora sp. CPCC 205371]|nr:RecX family transcriptional regulator [Micromonospora sp. CPCC 205371]